MGFEKALCTHVNVFVMSQLNIGATFVINKKEHQLSLALNVSTHSNHCPLNPLHHETERSTFQSKNIIFDYSNTCFLFPSIGPADI